MCEKSKDESAPVKPEDKATEKSYYYDDAHGYEDFDPEDGDETEENEGLA